DKTMLGSCAAKGSKGDNCGDVTNPPCDESQALICMPSDPKKPTSQKVCTQIAYVPLKASCNKPDANGVVGICSIQAVCDMNNTCVARANEGEACILLTGGLDNCYGPDTCQAGKCAPPKPPVCQ